MSGCQNTREERAPPGLRRRRVLQRRPERRHAAAVVALGVVQLPMQLAYGIMTGERFLYSLAALAPLTLFMPLGSYLGRRMSRRVFDLIILTLLTGLAVKLMADALS